MLLSISFLKFEYFLTNFGTTSFNPSISSLTNIWPSQYLEAPIPIVGTLTLFVILFAKSSTTHSIIIAKTPEFETATASSKIFFLLK